MPKRHNVFQDLIAAIHEQTAGPCHVRESDMLIDRITGKEREVDVVIRSTVAGYEFILSIECMSSSSRRASVEWVERMFCKHQSLPTQKLVLVCNSGFTRNAKAKARFLGVECYSLEAAKELNWTKYVDRHSELILNAIDAVTIVAPQAPTYKPRSSYSGIPMDTQLLDTNGKPRTTAEEFAHAVIANSTILEATMAQMDPAIGGGWEIYMPTRQGVRMRLPDGHEHELEAIVVVILADPMSVRIELERTAFRNTQVAYGNASHGNKEFFITILEAEGKPVNAQVRVRRPLGRIETVSLAGGERRPWAKASDETMRALVGRSKDA